MSFFQKRGKPLPKRGQVKVQIIGTLVRSLVPKSSKNGREQSSASFTPPMRGYNSEDSYDS